MDSLEKIAAEQGERIAVLTTQLEAAYQKVQDIAVKTVEGASNFKSSRQPPAAPRRTDAETIR